MALPNCSVCPHYLQHIPVRRYVPDHIAFKKIEPAERVTEWLTTVRRRRELLNLHRKMCGSHLSKARAH